MRVMPLIGIAGAVLLLVFTLWLGYRNLTIEIWKPAISVLIGGIVALLVTLLTILRPSGEQRDFVSTVVIDERTHLPANIKVVGSYFPDDSASLKNRITKRQSMISGFLAHGGPFPLVQNERTDALVTDFFQYKLLIDIRESLTGERAYTIDRDKQGINRFSVSVQKRIPPPRKIKVPGDRVLQWIKTNRLSQLPHETKRWQTSGLPFPEKAQLQLDNQIVDSVPERSIKILAPGFLNASISIKCLGSPG